MNKTGIQCCDPICYDSEISSECEMFCPKNFYMSESTGNINCSLQGRIISDRNGKENSSSILVSLCIHCDEVCNRTTRASMDSTIGIMVVIFSVSSLLISIIIVLVYLYHRVQRRRRKQLQVNMSCTVPSTLYFVFHWCCFIPFHFIPFPLLSILCFTSVVLYHSLYLVFCVSLVLFCIVPST